MNDIAVRPLSDDHDFGARIAGLTPAGAQDEAVRAEIARVFEDRGLIVFEEVEQSSAMHLAISGIAGPLQSHSYKGVPMVDDKAMPGVVDIRSKTEDADIFEVEGRQLSSWIPWHFDACYTARLNRGGVLRPITIPAEGGETGFVDGVQLFADLPPDLRERVRDVEVLYHPALMFQHMRFGRPDFRVVKMHEMKHALIAGMKDEPRSIHPAIWRRADGRQVLHVCPWQADGILGHEDPQGDALLEELCREVLGRMRPYIHAWRPGDMVMWDNWRLLHSAMGHDPRYPRHMHRTTIEGDYGLGRFEDGAPDRPALVLMD